MVCHKNCGGEDEFWTGILIEAIQTLKRGAISCVTNNGYWSNWFDLSKSCRQGCPYSPLIFDLVSEVIAAKIRQNPAKTGIMINGKEQIGAQNADDFWLFLINEVDNINAALCEFALFEQFSGLKTNFDKTIALPIGDAVNTQPLHTE